MSHVFSIICKNRSGINQGFVVSCCRASYFNSSKQEMKNTNKRVYEGVSDVGCESFDFLSNDNGRLQRNLTIKISASFHRHLILKGKLKGKNSSSDLHSSSQLSHVVSNWLQHCSYEHSCPPSRVSAPLQKKTVVDSAYKRRHFKTLHLKYLIFKSLLTKS